MDTIDKALIVIAVVLSSLVTGIICYDIADRGMKEQAVLKGYGEWKSRPDGSHNTFNWK